MVGKVLTVIFAQSSPIGTMQHAKCHKDYKGMSKMDIDAHALHVLLKDRLNIKGDIRLHNNRKKKEIEEIIKAIKSYTAYTFVFLTYLHRSYRCVDKNEDLIECYDASVSLKEIFLWMERNEVFHGKPKLFIVQADDLTLLYPGKRVKGSGGIGGSDDDIMTVRSKIPKDSDRLLLFSTLPQMLANPDRKTGGSSPRTQPTQSTSQGDSVETTPPKNPSFLIQAIRDVLCDPNTQDHAIEPHLVKQAVWINMRVKILTEQLRKDDKFKEANLPLPVVTSSLTNHFRLTKASEYGGGP